VTIHFVERELFIDSTRYELPYPIDDAIEYADSVVILFDPDSADEGNGRFHNLVAVDRSGQMQWTAELPTADPGDRYYKIASKTPLTVYSVRSYDCVIDHSSGHILERKFTKWTWAKVRLTKNWFLAAEDGSIMAARTGDNTSTFGCFVPDEV
jgi:hypothetical protein